MIIKESYQHSGNGRKRIRIYSDCGLKIRQIETEYLFNSVIETENSGFSYEESMEKAEMEVKRYSTLKVIRMLGEQWENIRKILAEKGLLDQFYAANYLQSDDPEFTAFLQEIPDDIRSKLSRCLWKD